MVAVSCLLGNQAAQHVQLIRVGGCNQKVCLFNTSLHLYLIHGAISVTHMTSMLSATACSAHPNQSVSCDTFVQLFSQVGSHLAASNNIIFIFLLLV